MFERQGAHLALQGGLLAAAAWAWSSWAASSRPEVAEWFWWSLAVPLLHQAFVWYSWRAALHDVRPRLSFPVYAAGFAFFALARGWTLVGLAEADRGTLGVDLGWLAALLALPVGYALYSVLRYFTVRRAVGADHFDPAVRALPLERRGIFRFTRNGMYTFAFLIMWIPALAWSSKAALVSAAFSHASIWAHYLCTELPDMRRIYGGAVSSGSRAP